MLRSSSVLDVTMGGNQRKNILLEPIRDAKVFKNKEYVRMRLVPGPNTKVFGYDTFVVFEILCTTLHNRNRCFAIS